VVTAAWPGPTSPRSATQASDSRSSRSKAGS
jgi:hypothetical protein